MSKQTQTKRAATYVRVSTVRQGEDGGGLEAQLTECRRFATALGYEIVAEDHDMVSGRKLDERAGLDRIVRAGKAGKFDVLVVREVSRFARKAKDALDVAEQLTAAGIEVTDVKGQSSANKLLFTILSAIAEYEADLIRERAVGGRVVAASQGRWIGGSTPYGYRVDDEKRLVLNDDEAEVIRTVFSMAIRPDEYPSALSIAKELKRRGIGPRQRNWGDRDIRHVFGHSHIQRYLSDTIYRGDGRQVEIGGETYTLPAPAIVNEDVFDQAQRVVEKRRKTYAVGGASKRIYGLTGRLVHAHGEGEYVVMRGETKIRHGKYAGEIRLYRCAAVRDGSGCPGTQVAGPKRTTVRADDIEARVLLWGLRLINEPDLFAEVVSDHQRSLVAAANDVNTRDALAAQLASVSERKARIVETYMDGLVTKDVRDARLADLELEREEIEGAIAGLDEKLDPTDVLAELMATDFGPPLPGDFQPGDIEWPDVERFLKQNVKAYHVDGIPLPPEVSSWVAHVADVLDLRIIVNDRDNVEVNGSTHARTLWKWS